MGEKELRRVTQKKEKCRGLSCDALQVAPRGVAGKIATHNKEKLRRVAGKTATRGRKNCDAREKMLRHVVGIPATCGDGLGRGVG